MRSTERRRWSVGQIYREIRRKTGEERVESKKSPFLLLIS